MLQVKIRQCIKRLFHMERTLARKPKVALWSWESLVALKHLLTFLLLLIRHYQWHAHPSVPRSAMQSIPQQAKQKSSCLQKRKLTSQKMLAW